MGERLAAHAIDAAYATSMRRTVETAEPLVRRSRLALRIEPDLREVNLGAWEGGTFRRKVLEQHPVALMLMQEQRWDVIPGAEPTKSLSARVRPAPGADLRRHPDQRLVVFTHGGVIGRILAEATGSQPFAFNADNGSISHVVLAGDRWTVRRFNDTAHLDGGFTTQATPLT